MSDGDQVDFANSRLGKEFRVRPMVDWNINRHLLMRVQHTMSRLDDQTGEKIFKADLTDLRVTWQFNLRSFVRFTMQRQLVTRNLDLYIASDTQAESLNVGTQLLTPTRSTRRPSSSRATRIARWTTIRCWSSRAPIARYLRR